MAQIAVKLSQAAVDKRHAIDIKNPEDGSLSESLDAVLELNYQVSRTYSTFKSWTTTSNALKVYFADGASATYTGTLANPNASSGTAVVTNLNFLLPGAISISQAGVSNYNYQNTNGALSFYPTTLQLSSYGFTSLFSRSSPYYDSDLGNSSVRLNGDIRVDADQNLSGNITQLSSTSDQFVRSETLTGNFQVSGNAQAIGQGIADSSVSGYLQSYNTSYYDGSYANFSDPGRGTYIANGQPLNLRAFSNPDLFPNNDTISVELPARLVDNWAIQSGAGNDNITLKGGGGRRHGRYRCQPWRISRGAVAGVGGGEFGSWHRLPD